MLLTQGALYSDGKRYLPAVTLAKRLGADFESVLALGVGLGSIVRVLRARGAAPHYTLVDSDPTVLGWAMDTLSPNRRAAPDQLEPVCQDAEAFMAENQRKFDLIFVDLFRGRRVPAFVRTPLFLRRCRASLTTRGHAVFNYLADNQQAWQALHGALLAVFPGAEVISIRDNRIVIGGASAQPEARNPAQL